MPPQYRFVYERQFWIELDLIESRPIHRDTLCQLVECACGNRIRNGALGLGFAAVSWTRNLLTWYHTDGSTVTLLSIRFDLRSST
jgi:hypothetical protein